MSSAETLALDHGRSVWRIVGDAFTLYRRYPILFVVLAVVVVAPYDLFAMAVTGEGPLAHGAHRTFALNLLLNLVGFSFVAPFISALHTHAVVLAGDGVTPRLRSVAARGLRVLPVVMAAEIVANLGIYLGLLLLVIPGIIFALSWSVTAQAAAVENEGWMPALKSSERLTSGNYRRIIGLFMLIGPPIVAIHLGSRALPLGGSSGIGSVALGVAINTVIASFGALVLALLYFDLRAREAAPAARRLHEYEHVRDLD